MADSHDIIVYVVHIQVVDDQEELDMFSMESGDEEEDEEE
jgi:hypothetical protein